MDMLEDLDKEGILPVHNDVIPSPTIQYSLVSGHNPDQSIDGSVLQPAHEDKDVFQSVVIANVDIMSLPTLLHAAVMEHIKKKSVHYIQVLHDCLPVNNFNKLDPLLMIFPMLFSFSIGRYEDHC